MTTHKLLNQLFALADACEAELGNFDDARKSHILNVIRTVQRLRDLDDTDTRLRRPPGHHAQDGGTD